MSCNSAAKASRSLHIVRVKLPSLRNNRSFKFMISELDALRTIGNEWSHTARLNDFVFSQPYRVPLDNLLGESLCDMRLFMRGEYEGGRILRL